MFCTCVGGGRRGFKKIDQLQGSLWGCENCGLPTRAVFKSLTAMRAPRGAVALISVFCRLDGINEITFALPGGERETVLEVAGKITVLERLWIELDTTMDALMAMAEAGQVGEPTERLRIKARAQAETLAILMDPFFSSADEVAREAKRRFDARKRGDESYKTPGLAGEEYVPPVTSSSASLPRGDESSQTGTKRTSSRRAGGSGSAARTKTLPKDAIPSITQALESGMFTVAQIAKSYGLTEAQVREQTGYAK